MSGDRHQQPPFSLRVKPELLEQLTQAAVAGNRSVNGEIARRLVDSFDTDLEGQRDRFAAAALQGASANPLIFQKFKEQGSYGQTLATWLAPLCYEMADAMLAARGAA